MTYEEKCDELIARAPDLSTAARLIERKSKLSPTIARMEYLPYGEYEKPDIEELKEP